MIVGSIDTYGRILKFVFFLGYNRITSLINAVRAKDATMKITPPRFWHVSDILVSYVVFAFLLVLTFGFLFLVPYPGFNFNPTNGAVTAIHKNLTSRSAPSLMIGDVLKSVGPISFEDYSNSATLNFFENYKPGDVVGIVVERNGKNISVPWVYPGFNDGEFISRLFNVWWLAYIFWLAGTAAQLFMRPKDKRWGLFVAFSYLTGMFIMLGNISSSQFLASPILMRVVAWLMLPVYLHFHWIFPRSLLHVPPWGWSVLYILCGAIAVMQFFSARPSPLYFVAVVLAFGGSILLLIAHYIFQPEHRREVSILAAAAFFSLGFTIIASIVGSSGYTPRGAVLSLLALPILPWTYFYVLYRRNLGGLELRTNRAISIYFYIMLLGIVLLLVFGFLNASREATIFAAMMVALVAAFVSILIFPAFQSFVEQRILGIKLPSQHLAESYSARIITSDTLSGLLKLLKDEVFPSLLIRQYAFVRNLDSSVQVTLSGNVIQDQVREGALKDLFASFSTGKPIPSSRIDPPLDWVLLTLPLQFGSDLIGLWLLGSRDPDDRYPQAELPILQSLANQTAVALSNIVQTERLKAMYETNINRYEQERLHLAHDLHDSILNEMAAILMKHDLSSLSPEFQESYNGLIGRVREIVSDFRPPMFAYGLKFALDGLADNLSERNQDRVQIVSDIQMDGEWRYPELVEHNLYRIVQEACENALKYSRAKSITVNGELLSERINITVTDDGIGFDIETSRKLYDMIASKHYGLAGMYERTGMIGAALRIDSKPGQGTQVQVLWETKNSV